MTLSNNLTNILDSDILEQELVSENIAIHSDRNEITASNAPTRNQDLRPFIVQLYCPFTRRPFWNHGTCLESAAIGPQGPGSMVTKQYKQNNEQSH